MATLDVLTAAFSRIVRKIVTRLSEIPLYGIYDVSESVHLMPVLEKKNEPEEEGPNGE